MLCIRQGWSRDRPPWVAKVNRGHHPLGISGGFPRSRSVHERRGHRQVRHSRGSDARLGGDGRVVEILTAAVVCGEGIEGQQ